MDIHKKHKYRGVWWRYGYINNKIHGVLEVIQNRNIRLQMDNLIPTKNGIHYLPEDIGTILGKTLKKESVALINCQHFFGDVYNSPMALIGGHYKDFDDIKFNSIKIFYTLLTEWAFKEEYLKENGISSEIKELGINIIINIDLKKKFGKRKKNKEEIISSITINSENSKNLHEWWDIIILLRNFIILGLNVPVYPCSFFGIKNNKKEVKIYRTTNTNFGSYSEQLRGKGYLFRLKDIKDNLNLYLDNLFKKSPTSDYGITRSFFLDKKIYDLLHVVYNRSQELYKTLYNDYISLGNFTELILYIYINDNIEKKTPIRSLLPVH